MQPFFVTTLNIITPYEKQFHDPEGALTVYPGVHRPGYDAVVIAKDGRQHRIEYPLERTQDIMPVMRRLGLGVTWGVEEVAV